LETPKGNATENTSGVATTVTGRRHGGDPVVELGAVLAVGEKRADGPDAVEAGAVPLGLHGGQRLVEVVGRAVAVVAVSVGEIGEYDAALH
jgi:hypothetical protein